MKKINFIMAASLTACAVSAQAQNVIAKVGFESSDQKYTTEWALTPENGTYGDWVNVKDVDMWNEQGKDAHSGEYALTAENSEDVGYTWDRGFKIGNLKLKDNTSYRVSFWVKADPEYMTESGEAKTAIKSSLSIGREYFDNELISPSGQSYNYNFTNGVMTGDWVRLSYVTFHTNKALLDAKAQSRYGANGVTIPASAAKEEEVLYPAGATDIQFPENYFVVINMYNPTSYALDDIMVEEGVAFNAATFDPSTATIKLDFGYPTNIATLAKENNGTIALDASCVKVVVDGKEMAADYVEGKADGFLYIFFEDDTALSAAKEVKVSFTPAADCPIKYNSDKRPSADVESDMVVLGFTDEVAYEGEEMDVMPSAWSAPVMVSATPENNSFELDGKTLKNIAIKFNQPIDISGASASLVRNGKSTSLNDAMSAEGETLNIAVSNLADGDYTLIVSTVANQKGFGIEEDITLKFSVGEDADETVAEDIYVPDWKDLANGTFPVGWVSDDNGTIHQYGLTDGGEVWNYNWGGNVGGGGCRAMTGYSGDFNGGAMYWRCMNGANALGKLTYGAQVNDFMDASGNVDPEMDPNIALYLKAGKYQISFKMAAWCNVGEPKPDGSAGEYDASLLETDYQTALEHPKYDFKLTDLSGTIVYAQFLDVDANPSVHRNQNMKVQNATNNVTDFTIDEDGYYVLEFSTTQANAELLMGNLKLITMPSKAAYYKGLLKSALEEVAEVIEAAEGADYDGDTKTKFMAAVKSAQEDHFTAPSEVESLIEDLKNYGSALQTRITNIDDFNLSIFTVQTAMQTVEGKYANAQIIKDAQKVVDDYAEVNPSTLSDEKLAEVTPIVKNAASQIDKVKDYVDILTFGALKATTAAYNLGSDPSSLDELVSDDRDAINAVNVETTKALYDKIIAGEDLTPYMDGKVYDPSITDEEYEDDGSHDSNGHPLMFQGIDLSGYVQNTHLYRVLGDDGVPGWTIAAGSEESTQNIAFNVTPSETNQVVDAQIAIYGNADYDMSQVVENLPAGVYNLVIQTRTPLVGPKTFEGDDTEYTFYYNAQNDETQEWDKYIYAQGDQDETAQVAPYVGAGGLTNTIIKSITVGEDGKMTIGAHEHYVSGKAVKHEDNTAQDFWTGTTYVDYINIYFVAPLEGFDYAKAKQDIIDAIDTPAAKANASVVAVYNVSGAKVAGLQKGINIVKMSNGTVKKVLVK